MAFLTFLYFVQNKGTKSQSCCYCYKCKLVNRMAKSKDSNILLYCFYINKNKKFDNYLFYKFPNQNIWSFAIFLLYL